MHPAYRLRIINISSLAGQHPFAGGAAYSATMAGLNAFGEALMSARAAPLWVAPPACPEAD